MVDAVEQALLEVPRGRIVGTAFDRNIGKIAVGAGSMLFVAMRERQLQAALQRIVSFSLPSVQLESTRYS